MTPWKGLAAVVLTTVAAMTPVFGVAALATPVEHGLPVSGTVFGLTLSGFFAMSAAGAPFARRIAARLPVSVVLALVNALAAAGLVIAALAPNAGVLGGALVVAGAGAALTQPVAGRFIAVRVPAHRLSLASGLVSAALGVSPLLPGLLAGLVAGPHGWRAALWAALVCPVLGLAVTPFSRETSAPAAASSPAPSEPSAPVGGGVGMVLGLWTVAAALATIGSNATASYFIQIGTHSGMSTGLAGIMQSVAGLLAVAVRLVAGIAADRAPRRNPAIVAGMMLAGGVGLLITAAGNPVCFVAGAALTVAGGWGWTGLLFAAVLRVLPGEGARAGGQVQLGLFTGAAVAPFAFGAVSGTLGLRATLLIAALVAGLGAVAMTAGTNLLRRAENPRPATAPAPLQAADQV
ncbi:MFS transporter [Actinomadura rupiterrae]|uniref:MFS transporter n=1 Tax=Actinomadura rupiterrae TaxID=559627 RepID=UPI0020A3E5C4|nr:MFS transporter [Actinomadura rupiterrae]MCP2338859.1 MFS family permease [Actinomadura rupiterrae]